MGLEGGKVAAFGEEGSGRIEGHVVCRDESVEEATLRRTRATGITTMRQGLSRLENTQPA